MFGAVALAATGLGVADAVSPFIRPRLAAAHAPNLARASRLPLGRTTVITANDGSVIGTFRPERLHVPLPPDRLPKVVTIAVTAAEDASFFHHPGVNLAGLARSLRTDVGSGSVQQGGSSITQQLVKNLVTGHQQTIKRKVIEARIALALEHRYSKREILAAYLNTTYFGEGASGIGAAALTYFGKEANDLTLSEAAMLAAIIPAPSRYNPRVDPATAERRRRLVLGRVQELHLASHAAVRAALAEAPSLRPPESTTSRYPYFVDYVRRYLLDDVGLSPEQVFAGGLRIETTLEPRVQDAAVAAIRRHLPKATDPQAAMAVVRPISGDVVALVGGRDWNRSHVNMALGDKGGGVGRQPGSSFKPFVLATALQQGASLHMPVAAPESYTPAGAKKPVHNYSHKGYGTVTLARAVAQSINTSFVMLAERVGPNRVAATARSLGIDLPRWTGASIAIGAYETSPLAMAGGFAAFANDGRFIPPSPVRRVIAPDGSVLVDYRADPRQAISPATARLVTSALQGVIAGGTGTAAQLSGGRPAAGKTGTTDDYSNAWFVGYTPQLAAATWVGFGEGNIPMRGIEGVAQMTGGTIPAIIWREVMNAALRDRPVVPFRPAPDRAASASAAAGAPSPTPIAPVTDPPAPSPPPTAAPAPAPAPAKGRHKHGR